MGRSEVGQEGKSGKRAYVDLRFQVSVVSNQPVLIARVTVGVTARNMNLRSRGSDRIDISNRADVLMGHSDPEFRARHLLGERRSEEDPTSVSRAVRTLVRSSSAATKGFS